MQLHQDPSLLGIKLRVNENRVLFKFSSVNTDLESGDKTTESLSQYVPFL